MALKCCLADANGSDRAMCLLEPKKLIEIMEWQLEYKRELNLGRHIPVIQVLIWVTFANNGSPWLEQSLSSRD